MDIKRRLYKMQEMDQTIKIDKKEYKKSKPHCNELVVNLKFR